MLSVAPFRAVRPSRDKAHLVATRSYVSYTTRQLRDKLTENPFSFLHIIHPDMSATKLHKTANLEDRFVQVRKKYERFLQDEILIREEKPAYYIYRQTKGGHPFTGIICAVSVQDYLEGKIKIHEQTLAKREETFVKYLDTTNINAEPVLLMSENSHVIEDIFEKYLNTRAEYDFTTTTKARHQLWIIDHDDDIKKVTDAYAKMSALYIADGHHRSSSSARLAQMRRDSGKQSNASEYCLAYVLAETNVRIYEYNRIVKDLNGLSEEDLLRALSQSFYVNEAPSHYKPMGKGEFSMYLNKQWYALNLKHHENKLDAQVLSDLVLQPILGIGDLRKDKRISFLEGPKGMEGLKHAIDKNKGGVAFGLFPVAIQEIKHIADEHLTMPPKSTWVEPKLRSGLVVYEL
ncbi:MAG: DUF1015 domain-containing protein [Flavobacteriales bacterium]|nr:DUF1015 domain-containing protein [Flavobacteriales bacterium]